MPVRPAPSRGFRPSGATPLGFQRQLVDRRGAVKGVLGRGDCKSLHTDRVTLIPGPKEEVALVRRIFDMYVREGMGDKRIAKQLNAEGIPTRTGRRWDTATIGAIIRNPAYIGTNVYGRKRRIGLGKAVLTAPESWLRVENAFEGIVDPAVFAAAQDIRRHRQLRRNLPNDELLRRLAELLKKHGRLTQEMVDTAPETLSCQTYIGRFGSMRQAFALIGYKGVQPGWYDERRPRQKWVRFRVLDELVVGLRLRNIPVRRTPLGQQLVIGDGFRVAVLTDRKRSRGRRARCRPGRKATGTPPDVTLYVRMNPWDDEVRDYYLTGLVEPVTRTLPPPNIDLMPDLELFRIADLTPLYELAAKRSDPDAFLSELYMV